MGSIKRTVGVGKAKWSGKITAIQPRAKVWRYVTDNRTHYLLGFNIFVTGKIDDGEEEKFIVAISDRQQTKLAFRLGDVIKGTAWPKKYAKREVADLYRSGALKVIERDGVNESAKGPPWQDLTPSQAVYEERGARMLLSSRWRSKCMTCVWANKSAVEIQWCFDRGIKKYRFETFCYGPKSCKFYDMGKPRSVPYRDRYSAEDNGSLDEICTGSRGWDE